MVAWISRALQLSSLCCSYRVLQNLWCRAFLIWIPNVYTLWCHIHCTHCGEMPSLIGKQNSKTKWLFLVKKADQGIIWDIRWRIVHQTELLGLSYQSVAENLHQLFVE